ILTKTIGAKNPASLSPTELKPKTIPPKPSVEYRIDNQSIFGFVTSETLIKCLYAKNIENKANGITVINKNRQPKYSTITADNVGPIAGANMMTKPTTPMTVPRRCGGNTSKNVLKIIGINNPVPIAWNIRPASSTEKVGALAQMSVPIVKTVMVAKNICLVVNHCKKTADIGTTIPITSINPVAIHCTCDT